MNPKRDFRPGHDAKLKSALLAAWDDGQGAMAEELVTRGWYSWEQLQERQTKRDEKAKARLAKATKGKAPDADAEVKDDAKEDVA